MPKTKKADQTKTKSRPNTETQAAKVKAAEAVVYIGNTEGLNRETAKKVAQNLRKYFEGKGYSTTIKEDEESNSENFMQDYNDPNVKAMDFTGHAWDNFLHLEQGGHDGVVSGQIATEEEGKLDEAVFLGCRTKAPTDDRGRKTSPIADIMVKDPNNAIGFRTQASMGDQLSVSQQLVDKGSSQNVDTDVGILTKLKIGLGVSKINKSWRPQMKMNVKIRIGVFILFFSLLVIFAGLYFLDSSAQVPAKTFLARTKAELSVFIKHKLKEDEFNGVMMISTVKDSGVITLLRNNNVIKTFDINRGTNAKLYSAEDKVFNIKEKSNITFYKYCYFPYPHKEYYSLALPYKKSVTAKEN